MYTSFHVKNFRLFDDLRLDNLGRVNLIAGKNNVGKTALLEAIYLHCHPYSPEVSIQINTSRGMKTETRQPSGTVWDWIFSDFNTLKDIDLEGEDRKTGRRILQLRIVRDQEILAQLHLGIPKDRLTNGSSRSYNALQVLAFDYQQDINQEQGVQYMTIDASKNSFIVPTAFSTPFPSAYILSHGRPSAEDNATRFTNLEIAGKQDLLLKALKIIEPRIKRLLLLYIANEPMIGGEIELEKIPLTLMGDGINRITNLVMSIADSQDGVVLIDEIENGLHYSILKDVWKAIAKAAQEFNTQIFATTHSRECIVAAHEAFSESNEYDFRLHRLDRTKIGDIRSVTYDQESLQAAIDADFEVR